MMTFFYTSAAANGEKNSLFYTSFVSQIFTQAASKAQASHLQQGIPKGTKRDMEVTLTIDSDKQSHNLTTSYARSELRLTNKGKMSGVLVRVSAGRAHQYHCRPLVDLQRFAMPQRSNCRPSRFFEKKLLRYPVLETVLVTDGTRGRNANNHVVEERMIP